jgi:uncharacterized Zn finger protein (UPF0148 family)
VIKDRENTMSLPCPACGFLTIEDKFYGTYDICPVCGWKDDHAQLANPACKGGANPVSLIEVQKKVLREVPLDFREYKSFMRDKKWRPLSKEEIEKFSEEKKARRWMNKGVISTREVYWVKREERSSSSQH